MDYKDQSLATAGRSVGPTILAVRNDAGGDLTGGTDKRRAPFSLDSYGALRTNPESQYPIYRAAIVGLVPVASATDLLQIIGSATTVVGVRRIVISGKAGTAIGVPISIARRSTANTGGTSTAPTAIKGDSADAAATAVVAAYTANPTSGTETGILAAAELLLPVTTTTGLQAVEFDFRDAPVILRGVAAALAVKANGVSVSSGLLNIMIEWDERPLTA